MRRFFALIFALSLLLTACSGTDAKVDADALARQTVAVLLESNPEPIPGPLGGEWLVLGMCRLGYDLPGDWVDGYRQKLEGYVDDCGGILHDRKFTEYSRVILTVTAMGMDARNVAGYDLTAPLEDYDQTIFQGVNGAVYALLALDSGNYGSEDIRECYIAHILEKELPGGGWCLMGDVPEADVTAMALQALAKYRDRENVKSAVERGLKALEAADLTTCEAVAQTIVALSELEIRCDTLLKNLDKLSPGKAGLVPKDGVLLEKTTMPFEPGGAVFDVLRQQKIHYENVDAKAYGSTYIEGIGNLYEFDCGEESGWLYFVNGTSLGLGCSGYTVANGDEILFAYTCDFGADLSVEKIGE